MSFSVIVRTNCGEYFSSACQVPGCTQCNYALTPTAQNPACSPPQTYRRFSASFTGPYPWVVSSGVRGLEELTIPLGKSPASRKFTVDGNAASQLGMG